jgi:ankyrin repeat protein
VNDADSKSGMTPLEEAVISENRATIVVLLQSGANVDQFDKLGYNPVYHSIRRKNLDILQVLVDHGSRVRDLRFDGEQITPLMVAALVGSEPIANRLLALGLNPAARSRTDKTAADYARLGGYIELAKHLEVAVISTPATNVSR